MSIKCKNFNQNCGKKEFCPFFHEKEEKRRISNIQKEDFDNKLKIRKNSANSENRIKHDKLNKIQSSYNMNNISSHSDNNYNNQPNQTKANKSQVFFNNRNNSSKFDSLTNIDDTFFLFGKVCFLYHE